MFPLIYSRVAILQTGEVNINTVENFIQLHTIPCRKHGRKICADCYYYGDCTKCLCQRYVPDPQADASGICKRCHHPPIMHRICPLQDRKAASDDSLLKILRADRDPDLSLTTTKELGVTAEELIKKPIDAFDEKLLRVMERKRVRLQTRQKMLREAALTMTQQLAKCRLQASDVMDTDEYWEQQPVSMLDKDPDALLRVDVKYNYPEPHFNLTMEGKHLHNVSAYSYRLH
jgi:hypothetical protein